MTQVMNGLTKDGKAIPIRVDEQGRVVVVVVVDKPGSIVQRLMKRVRGKRG